MIATQTSSACLFSLRKRRKKDYHIFNQLKKSLRCKKVGVEGFSPPQSSPPPRRLRRLRQACFQQEQQIGMIPC